MITFMFDTRVGSNQNYTDLIYYEQNRNEILLSYKNIIHPQFVCHCTILSQSINELNLVRVPRTCVISYMTSDIKWDILISLSVKLYITRWNPSENSKGGKTMP